VNQPPVPPDIDRIKRRSERHRRRRTAIISVAALAVLMAGVGVVTSVRHTSSTDVATLGPAGTSISTSTIPAQGSTRSTPVTRDTTPPVGPATALNDAPPWGEAPLAAATVPEEVRAWNSDAAAAAACALLVPDDLGAGAGAGATARASDRGQPGAWWIAYDLPGAPGEIEIQQPAPGAGKQTFSVSGTVPFGPYSDPATQWDNKHYWSDGSSVGYGVLGRGALPPTPGMDPAWLAYLHVAGSDCFYQVLTYLGPDHLIHLLNHLRYVTGAP
jgi:hypothetical protein